MPEPRYLIAAALLALLTAAPLTGWPPGQISAHAQTMRERDGASERALSGSPVDLLTVASSNENERLDREERRGRNQNDQDDNDDGEDWTPPPAGGSMYEPPPDQSATCLAAGESVTMALPGGGATVRVFQDNLFVELARVDPSGVPSPGSLVGQLVFRLTAASCGGQALGALPGEANLGVTYTGDAVSGRDASKLALMLYDGQRWSPAPKQANDPPHRYVSATIAAPGIYALVQQ